MSNLFVRESSLYNQAALNNQD
uniref:Uncharacterized protein n=1 Tax=Anguilla anguilla TaxID=7936 RepID=A0A0E9VL83_ANGAN